MEELDPIKIYKVGLPPPEVCAFYLNTKNYNSFLEESYDLFTTPPENPPRETGYRNAPKLWPLPQKHQELFTGLVPDFPGKKGLEFEWMASLTTKGNGHFPHIEIENVSRKGEIRVCLGKFIFWVTPDSYKGRDFVWGSRSGPLNLLGGATYYSWEDPENTELGRLHPVTGDACIIGFGNHNIWHGVTPMITDDVVATIGCMLYL